MQYSALVLALCFGSVFCQVSTNLNLVELAQQLHLNVLVKQLQSTSLADTLAVGGNYTLFAPSDNAFGKITLPSNVTELLKYHVVSGIYTGSSVFNEQKLTSLLGPSIRINTYAHTKKLSAEGAAVYRADELATNGAIWLLDTVMGPPGGGMMDYINKQTSGMSILKKAIETAGFAPALQADPLTLFAPNDAAFNRLAPGILDRLMADKDKLRQVLQYHVIPGALFTSGMHNGYVRTIDHGEQFQIRFSFFGLQKHINNAAIESEDIDTTNGVIHVIDHMLNPPDLI